MVTARSAWSTKGGRGERQGNLGQASPVSEAIYSIKPLTIRPP